MTSREYGAPQENTNVVLNMATEKLYGAARIPEMCTKRTIKQDFDHCTKYFTFHFEFELLWAVL